MQQHRWALRLTFSIVIVIVAVLAVHFAKRRDANTEVVKPESKVMLSELRIGRTLH